MSRKYQYFEGVKDKEIKNDDIIEEG